MKVVSLVKIFSENVNNSWKKSYIQREYSLYPVKFGKMTKDKFAGEFICLSMAPVENSSNLRICYEYGAEKFVLLNDKAFAGADTYATSSVLVMAIKKIIKDFNIIVCNTKSSFGETGHMVSSIAARLNIPFALAVTKILEMGEEKLTCVQNHGYYEQTITIQLPAIISLDYSFSFEKEIDEITLFDIKRAEKKNVIYFTAKELDVSLEKCGEIGSKTVMVGGKYIEKNKNHIELIGSIEEQCKKIMEYIKM